MGTILLIILVLLLIGSLPAWRIAANGATARVVVWAWYS